MSVDLNVFLNRSMMPTPTQWAQAIIDSGFDTEMDSDFDVDDFMGFLPCKHGGVDSGFEYYSDTVSPADRTELDLPNLIDFSVTFVTGSNIRESMTSLISAGVLCKLSGGTLHDPQSGDSYSADTVLDWIRVEIAAHQEHL